MSLICGRSFAFGWFNAMELIYLLYNAQGKTARYILLLYLGNKGDKYVGILTDAVSDFERSTIKAHSSTLQGLSLERRTAWVKANCPQAFQKGYREIFSKNVSVISHHPF